MSPIPTFTSPPSPQLASPTLSTVDETESSDDDGNYLLTDEINPGWEPPLPPDNRAESNSPRDNGTDDDTDTDTDANPLTPPTPSNDVRQRTWVTPKVVQFPGSRAGEPTGSASSSNRTYATSLGDLSSSNPYSPFSSKIDWEVAQWAKLHGPSSTSFAELLKIDGVWFHNQNIFVPY